MVWKLCFAVLAVQVSCLLADGHGMAEMFLQMMREHGGDMSDSEADPRQMLMDYMKEHGISVDDNPVVRLLQKVVEMSEEQIAHYQMMQSFDLVTKAIMEDILTNDDGVNEFAKDLALKRLKQYVQPAGELKDIMGMLFDHLMMNPKSENRDTIMQLLFHVTAQQSKEDRSMLRVMMLHLIEKTDGDQRVLVQALFATLMSDDLGGGDVEPREMFLLMIQSLMDQLPIDQDKKAMGLMILHNLSQRQDRQARDMMRDFIMKVILAGSEPFDIEEDDRWKFETPGPCRVEELDGTVVVEHRCPHDFSCDVGPVTYSFEGKNKNFFMCHFSAEYLEYFAFHSCEVTYPGGYVDRRPACATTACDFGPFTMTVEDNTYQAKFCSDYSNYTFDVTTLDPKIYRACALIDPYTELRVVQRRCPNGLLCNGKPHWTQIDSYHMKLVMCQKSGYREDDLLLRIVNAALGYEDEEEPEQGDMMGGDRVANMTNEHSVSEFLNYVVLRLWHMQTQQGQASMNNDEDVMIYYALQYLIHEVGDDDQLLVRFLRTLETKYYMGIVTDADRVFAHGVLANLMVQLYERQGGEDGGREGRNAVDGLMSLLRQHANEHMRINRVIEDHHEEHERMGENLQNMIQMILGQQPNDERDGQQGGMEGTEGELIEELLKKLLGHSEKK